MANVLSFLTRTRGRGRFDLTDWLTWGYLALAVLLMFGPVFWVALQEYPPSLLPLAPASVAVEGHEEPLQLFRITGGEHEGKVLAQIRRIGLNSQMVDPENPGARINVNINDVTTETWPCPLRVGGTPTDDWAATLGHIFCNI